MCFCLFFFKQKTAYEVRISDWSSDVCSSDLFEGGCVELAQVGGDAVDTCQAAVKIFKVGHHDFVPQFAFFQIAHQVIVDHGELARQEIGRASCRERVCPYV